MFLLPEAVKARGPTIAKGWAGSLTMGAGQFCTNPGISVIIDSPEADAFVEAVTAALSLVGAQTMLTDGLAQAYRAGRDRVAGVTGIQELLTSTCDLRHATPYLFATTGREWLDNEILGEEVFGPLADAGARAQGWPGARQRLPDRCRGRRFHGARRAITGLDQFRRDLGRDPVDPPLPAPGLLPEHAN